MCLRWQLVAATLSLGLVAIQCLSFYSAKVQDYVDGSLSHDDHPPLVFKSSHPSNHMDNPNAPQHGNRVTFQPHRLDICPSTLDEYRVDPAVQESAAAIRERFPSADVGVPSLG